MANPGVEETCAGTEEQPFNYPAMENPADDFVLDKETACRAYIDNVAVTEWVAKSEQEAYDLYRCYAHKIGFSIRKEHHSFYPNSRKIKDKDFVCSRAGLKKEPKANAKCKYQKSTTRTGCKILIKWSVDEDGEWTVKRWTEEHNHDFVQKEDQHLLRSSRSIDIGRGSLLLSMTNAGIKPVNAFGFMADEAGGVENVGFTKRDAYNYIQKEKRNRMQHGDATTLIQLFKERELTDTMFAWDAQFDEDKRLSNFFWVDGGGRIDYDCYGDVIVFDTSYRLNKYNFACAPIVGVNNHWQNILLGVAFLSEETIESFTWLFKTFLRIMGGKQPSTIFTDQDQAMARAIENALPNTRHRLCQWHIYKKAPSKVACFNSNKPTRELFYKCLSKCDSENEFEQAWGQMLSEGNLHGHAWLEDLYRIRHKWSTAFNKNIFCMDILTTQRSECTNNVCHGISKATSTITDCFLGLEKLTATWRRNERDEDHHNSQSEIVPIMKHNSILKQAAKFYSKRIYSFFEAEFMDGLGSMMLEKCVNHDDLYLIRSQDSKHQGKQWVVQFKISESIIQCTCCKFETKGLLCSHCLRVISYNNVLSIPDQYLLPRWSKAAKKDSQKMTSHDVLGSGSSNCGCDVILRNYACRRMYEITTRAGYNKGAGESVFTSLDKLSIEVDNWIIGEPTDSAKNGAPIKQKPVKFKDPAKVRPKGISNARLKSPWEKPKRKKKEKAAGGGSKTAAQCSSMQERPGFEQNMWNTSTTGQCSSMPEFPVFGQPYLNSNQIGVAEDSGMTFDQKMWNAFDQQMWKFYGGFSTQ